MKRAICTGILAASVVAAYVTWQSGKFVYNIVGGDTINLHAWAIGPQFYEVGFCEYYNRDAGLPNTQDKMFETPQRPIFTRICFGKYLESSVTVRAHSWLVVFAASSMLGALIALALDGWGWTGK
jgi:hypothetical protein